MTDQWRLDRERSDKTLAALRADPLWIETTHINGLIEFKGRHTGDIYRVTTTGNMMVTKRSTP